MLWRRALGVIVAMSGVGCTDGAGAPIRERSLLPVADADVEIDDDGGFDEREHFDAAYCAGTVAWPDSYDADERALLSAINEVRRRGLRCEDRELDRLEPLDESPALRCSARLHSLDMVERDFIGRTNPDGESPRDRMRRAGFNADESDESIVVGEPNATAVLEALLQEWDDCNNVGSRELTHVGIGRYQDHWTLDFARAGRGDEP